jgi:hypothetical protein
MAAIPQTTDPTLLAMNDLFEIAQDSRPRSHLGASMIGDNCHRKLWYSFRWTANPVFYASTLYRFEDGHRSEDIVAERLRLVPELELHTHTPEGGQFNFKDHGGHFAGSADGFVKGLLQAPKTPHVWEHKCCNETKFKKLDKLKKDIGEKNALLEWDGIYYAQGQVYMHYFGMTRHYLTCATPGSRDITSVRTDYHPEFAKSIVDKAAGIIASDTPPTKITEKADSYLCKWCTFKEQCHYDAPIAENCRTCKHSKPVDGGWHCYKHNTPLDYQTQYEGCGDFVAIDGLPALERVA